MDNLLMEHTTLLLQKEYVKIFSKKGFVFKKKSRFILMTTIVIMCLFWTYTFLLALLILLFILFILVTRTLFTSIIVAKKYGKLTFLHNPINYKLFENKVTIKSEGFSAELGWEFLRTWQVRKDWFVLIFNGFPNVYIPVAIIEKSAHQKQILELIKSNGKKE